MARNPVVAPSRLAIFYLRAGEKELALEWLERGFEMREPNMPYISVPPQFDILRHAPRFQDLLRRMNLPQ